jgi:hypothetical protein
MPEVLLACARPDEVPAGDWDELASLIDADERDRSRRFRFDADRQAFVLAHALLRALVGAESGMPPDGIRIVHDVKGRPFVESAPELQISLSRSREVVACASHAPPRWAWTRSGSKANPWTRACSALSWRRKAA